jgi:threonine synthase
MESYVVGLRCLRCGRPFQGERPFEGCPKCREDGYPANLTVDYSYDSIRQDVDWWSLERGPASMWRYRTLLPVRGAQVSLQEGMTPLVEANKLARKWGIGRLLVKDEGRNPTGSFKDRMASVVVSKALEEGASAVTLASSGNGGAALAAYAARAGLDCVIFALAQAPKALMAQMAAYGAHIVALKHPADRWTLMGQCVARLGWYPAGNYVFPPVGSNPYGLEGYKTIAYELFHEMAGLPDDVIVPTCYADGLWGIAKGFLELKELGLTDRLPRVHAAEVFGSLRTAMASGADTAVQVPAGHSVAISIATGLSTYQGIVALRSTRGQAATVGDGEILQARRELAETEGLFAEASSAASLAVARKLAEEGVLRDRTVVCVMTSSGLKDAELAPEATLEIPVLPGPDGDLLMDVLRERYGMAV